MKKFLLGVLIGFLFAGLALVIVAFAMVRLSARPPHIPDQAVLVLRLEGELPERPRMDIPLPFFQLRSPPTVRDLWELLRKAAADPRIRAVVFMPQSVEAGWGKLEEIRSDLLEFRKSGKPLYAYLRAPGAREYYMATAAERVSMAPEDYLDLKGLRAELIYLKNTLNKLGVNVEIVHAGKYKDAGDILTRDSMSPETREVMNSVLDGLYGQLVGAIASARKKSLEDVRAIIDRGPFISQEALAEGLVDLLRYQDQVFDELKQRLKLKEIRRVSTRDYLQAPAQSVGMETGRRIAFVVAEGDIVRRGADLPEEGFISPGELVPLLRRIAGDSNIKGVIVRIDSPGGDGFASDEIWREMNLLSKKKPLVISMSDLAASGGYYIAMTGDPVLSYPGTFTGSIGVFYGKADLRGLYDKLGVRKNILSRGRFADIDSDYTPLTDEARKKVQNDIERFYRSFVKRVADGRKRGYDQVEPLAQGRVWLGSQAKANGLIDEFGGIDRAIEMVKRKAGIPREEKIRLVTYPPRRSILDRLFGTPPEALLPHSELLAFFKRFATSTWARGGMFKLMPYRIEVK